jgi:hypothetical protein
MALREFSDEHGRRWRAWDILPDQLHPSTRVEDYMQGFVDGWLAFESIDGAERARLTPVPIRWHEGSEEQMRALLARAERGGPRRPRASRSGGADAGDAASRPTGERGESEWSGSWPALSAERGLSAPPGTMRTFRYPGGRFWSVYEHVAELPSPGAAGATRPRVVLRFTSGSRALDLLAWPADWFEHSDEELAELLWRAFPRSAAASAPDAPRRRRGDRPALA